MTDNPTKHETVSPPESGFSLNWHMRDGYGAQVQITMRAALLADFREVMTQRKAFIESAMQHGWTVGAIPAPERPPAPAPAQAEPQPIPVPIATETQASATFAAETLSATVADGKAFWKIKGAQYSKFGVTVYPEVLDAAGFANLDALKTYNLKGFAAEYVTKDGKPHKVTKLTKA